jgi:hypothetical protein
MKKKDHTQTAKACMWISPFVIIAGIGLASILLFVIGLLLFMGGIAYANVK